MAQDFSQAADYYRQACDGMDADGCFFLGVLSEDGRGVKQSETDALMYYGKACDLHNKDGCEFYAKLKQEK